MGQQLKEQTVDITNNVNQYVNNAYRNGRDKGLADVNQRLDGQQSRIDIMTSDKTEADKMASADHATLQQIKKHFASTMKIVTNNTKMQSGLINQLQQPITFDAKLLVKAIEDEAGLTMNQLFDKKALAYINAAVNEVNVKSNAVEASNNQVLFSHQTYGVMMMTMLGTIGIASVLPWWPVKLVIVVIGMLGAVIYGGIRKILD